MHHDFEKLSNWVLRLSSTQPNLIEGIFPYLNFYFRSHKLYTSLFTTVKKLHGQKHQVNKGLHF